MKREMSGTAAGFHAPLQGRDRLGEQIERQVQQALEQADVQRLAADAARRAAQEQGVDAGRLGQDGGSGTRIGDPSASGPPSQILIQRPGRPPVTVTTTGTPFGPFGDVPPRAQEVAFGFFFTIAAVFIGTPLARAFARRMDRRPVAAAAASPDVVSRLERIEQSVEAVALEVERISEGQRYVTKLMSEARALPTPNDADAQQLRMVERAAAARAAADPMR